MRRELVWCVGVGRGAKERRDGEVMELDLVCQV